MKPGTRIEFYPNAFRGSEAAVIIRKSRLMGDIPVGFHPVRMVADNARLMAHESSFRVVSNQ